MYVKMYEDNTNTVKWCIHEENVKRSFGKIIITINKHENFANIDVLFLEPSYRKMGYSEMLINIVKKHVEEIGCEYITLDAEEDTEYQGSLVKFYKENGFKIKNVGKPFQLIYHEDKIYRKVPMIYYIVN